MASSADIRQRVKDYLYSAAPHEHPFVTLLNGAINNSVTSVVLDTGVGDSFTEGDTIEINAELMLVTAVSTDTLTVIRGYRNTTAASHSDNDPITKNPRFSVDEIDNALDSVMRSLESWGIHAWGTGSLTLVANQTYYDLTDTDIMDPYGVLNVYYAGATTLLPTPLPFRYMTQLHTTVSATGHGLHLWEWGDKVATDTVYYTYAQTIDALGDVLARQEELVVLGACTLLLGGTIGPATHDPGARTDRTVAPGQTSRDVRFFQGEFFIRARTEAAQLAVERNRQVGNLRLRRSRRWRN